MSPWPSYKTNPLPAIQRFYFYGIQGFCDEIIFTSLFDFLKFGDWSLKGHSSISTFFIYGSCSLLVERLYVYMYLKHGVKWYVRMPLYLCICYLWEFTCGSVLRVFDACPWDYSHYDYNYKGLITLEYAPGWLVLCWLQDVMADYLLRVQILPTLEDTTNAEHEKTPNLYPHTESNGTTYKFVSNTEMHHINDRSVAKHIKSY